MVVGVAKDGSVVGVAAGVAIFAADIVMAYRPFCKMDMVLREAIAG